MNTLTDTPAHTLSATLLNAVTTACGRIAPAWPLDRMIAVNPWWKLRESTMADTAARLEALSGIKMLMPPDYFQNAWGKTIQARHLERARARIAPELDQTQFLAALDQRPATQRWHNVSDWMDQLQGVAHRMSWGDEIVHQISQTCALYFQKVPPGTTLVPENGLYSQWLDHIQHDAGLEILMGEPGLQRLFRDLPSSPQALIANALGDLALDANDVADYLHALLLDVNGWASWMAWLEWQAGLDKHTAPHWLKELLAIRLAWEWVVWRHARIRHPSLAESLSQRWARQWERLPDIYAEHAANQLALWCWQEAAELASQESLQGKLQQPAPSDETVDTPVALQAAFCIDVRSEPLRLALEKQDSSIQTLGFAGFFGLPIATGVPGSDWLDPQLPGLLAPQIEVHAETPEAKKTTARKLNRQARMGTLNDGPSTTFSLVESLGLGYALKLARDTFFPAPSARPGRLQSPGKGWLLQRAGTPLSPQETAALLARILRAMGLTQQFAPWVLLVGHGSTTRNNPHAASLNCGACGGQTGLTNARVLADLLNVPALRDELARLGLPIPASTRFIAALHDTVTDDIDLPSGTLPEPMERWLAQASQHARRRRAPSLGLAALNDARLERALQQRTKDWSELRPEWGLANNVAFIAAPRAATAHLDLEGRCFLHDYAWEADPDHAILELIMTAPMVVANWINLQYYASVVDNARYGSGNKMLHNVVGGHIGVFEGNGGDLRIGLPLQSVHDGRQWRHEPLRLQIYIAAPESAIQGIYEKHEAVRQLVDNHWLTLFSWDTAGRTFRQLFQGQWNDVIKAP